MTEDQINKVETLIGYLEYFVSKRQNNSDEIAGVVEDAKEWIAVEKEKTT